MLLKGTESPASHRAFLCRLCAQYDSICDSALRAGSGVLGRASTHRRGPSWKKGRRHHDGKRRHRGYGQSWIDAGGEDRGNCDRRHAVTEAVSSLATKARKAIRGRPARKTKPKRSAKKPTVRKASATARKTAPKKAGAKKPARRSTRKTAKVRKSAPAKRPAAKRKPKTAARRPSKRTKR